LVILWIHVPFNFRELNTTSCKIVPFFGLQQDEKLCSTGVGTLAYRVSSYKKQGPVNTSLQVHIGCEYYYTYKCLKIQH